MKRLGAILTAILLSVSLCVCTTSCQKQEEGEADGTFTVTYRDVKLTVGEDAEPVLKALGEPSNKKEIGDCGGLGAQVRYDYSSLILYVLESKEGDVIDQITLTDDLVSTQKGIGIGDSQDKVKEAYGNVLQSDGSRLVYTSGNKTLTFQIENGTVSGIDLMQVTQ